MKETLMLLRPDVRHTRIVESVEKSITMAGRMKEQAQGNIQCPSYVMSILCISLIHSFYVSHHSDVSLSSLECL